MNYFALQPRGIRENFFGVFILWVLLSLAGTLSAHALLTSAVMLKLFSIEMFISPSRLTSGSLAGVSASIVAFFQMFLLHKIARQAWLWPLVTGAVAFAIAVGFPGTIPHVARIPGTIPHLNMMLSIALAIAQAGIIYPVSRRGFLGGTYWVIAMAAKALIPILVFRGFFPDFIENFLNYVLGDSCTGLLLAYWASRIISSEAQNETPQNELALNATRISSGRLPLILAIISLCTSILISFGPRIFFSIQNGSPSSVGMTPLWLLVIPFKAAPLLLVFQMIFMVFTLFNRARPLIVAFHAISIVCLIIGFLMTASMFGTGF